MIAFSFFKTRVYAEVTASTHFENRFTGSLQQIDGIYDFITPVMWLWTLINTGNLKNDFAKAS